MSETWQLLQGDYIRRPPLQQMLPLPAVAGILHLLCLGWLIVPRKQKKTEKKSYNTNS